jgi:hypothetical protein
MGFYIFIVQILKRQKFRDKETILLKGLFFLQLYNGQRFSLTSM